MADILDFLLGIGEVCVNLWNAFTGKGRRKK